MSAIGMLRIILVLSVLTCHYFLVFIFTKTLQVLLEAYMAALKFGIAKCFQCISTVWSNHLSCKKKLHFQREPHSRDLVSLRQHKTSWAESTLLSLLTPLRKRLSRSHFKMYSLSSYALGCAQEYLQKIFTMPIIPEKINIDSMLMFIYGAIFKTIPNLVNGGGKANKTRQLQDDQMLVPIRRVLLAQNVSWTMAAVRANAHVLYVFSLELFQSTLNSGNLLKITYQPFVHPFILILNNPLGSSHIRATAHILKNITIKINKQMSLKRLDAAISSILASIFLQPMQRVVKSIVNILGIDQRRICQC